MASPIHLSVTSNYSLLSSLATISGLVKKASECGMEALALTDENNMYGTIAFYKACKKKGIKPIIGVTLTLLDGGSVIILARGEVGYKNLVALVTKAHTSGSEHIGVSTETLNQHRDDTVVILPMLHGPLTSHYLSGNTSAIATTLKALEHPDSPLFLEVSPHKEAPGYQQMRAGIDEAAKAHGLPRVFGMGVMYIAPEDREACHVLRKIKEGRGATMPPGDRSFWTPEHIAEFVGSDTELIENTKKIAAMVNLELELGTWNFPAIDVPGGVTAEEALRKLAYEGIDTRAIELTDAVKERLEYELDIICDKGFAPYFLVVGDLLQFARENNILTTTRGSAAGSLVSYAVGITNVNPLFYNLPFERFLNPERPKAPDIDMDFADNRRDEVIDYARRRYGSEKVAQIGTFGTMLARAAVRDTARALGYSYGVGDRIAKLIPMGSQGFAMTIDRAVKMEPELKELIATDDEVAEIIEVARKVEGSPRHISVHAAGVVIAPTALSNWVPVQLDPKGGKLITQYDMHAVEEAGLLKFDFLGIRNLAILGDAVSRAEKRDGIDIDIENVPIDDAKTFEMLARGETEGLFQLNGDGMTKYLVELKPTSIHDINAMVALYRPGPIESIPQYIERKHNPALITYLDERLKDILKQSFGLLVYQDDVLLSAITLAGYSWLEADTLRKAMGKKIPAEMEAQREKLLTGLVKYGMTAKKAQELWKLIEPFAAYGFNKAHAASYGKVAYQTAYMKANYPVEYMAALMTAESGMAENIADAVHEAKRMNIDVLPPDVCESDVGFSISGSTPAIRFGLSSIKNFGEGISHAIVLARGEQPFTSLENFLERIPDRGLNKKAMESLIKCGALDQLGDRSTLLASLEAILAFHKETHAQQVQDSLFGSFGTPQVRLTQAPPTEEREKLVWEKELLGIFVSGHPLDPCREALQGATPIKSIIDTPRDGMVLNPPVGGIIESMKTMITKNGDRMAFLRVADFTGSIDVVVFPQLFKAQKDLWEIDRCIAIRGRVAVRNGSPSLVIEEVMALS